METQKDKAYGVIPVFKDPEGNFLFCLIKHAEGHWGFPKGHQDPNESEQETALRELKEETGIDNVDLSDNKSFAEEYGFEQDGVIHDKYVKYFLGFTFSIITMTENDFKSEIPELKWVNYEDAKNLITFPQAKGLLDQAFEYLNNKK